VVSDQKISRDSDDVSDEKGRMKHVRYDGRQRFYGALLLFVVIVGLPIVAVPSLRERLSTRVAAIKSAIGGYIDPVSVEIGEEQAPFPKEYERFAASFPGPGQPLPLDRIFTARMKGTDSKDYSPPALMTPEPASTGKPVPEPDSVSEETPSLPGASESDSNDGLDYNQGAVEQDAYALLLKSYPKVAEMVEGGDPALRFISWGAVKRGEDQYWVRLIFKNEENVEVEYIWSVEIESKKVLPLSYNARSIS
jgi:hypothetical protein